MNQLPFTFFYRIVSIFPEEHKLCFHQQFPAALNSRKQLAGELGGVHSAEEPDIFPLTRNS